MSFRRVANLIGREIPIILETLVPFELMEHEIEMARSILELAGDEVDGQLLVDVRNPPMQLGPH